MPDNNSNLELLELTEEEVDLDNIMIDPNNPRLLEMGFEEVPDERITEDRVQQEALTNIKQAGLKDIIEKVKKFGFLCVDKVVVRPLNEDKYVVIEGNRRISSLKILQEDHLRGRISLDDKILDSMKYIKVLVYNGDNKDVVWLLQGIRHIKGIKEWGPLQQGKYLSDMQERRGLRSTDLSKMTGIGRTTLSQLIRSYYGWKQAKEDGDYGDRVSAEHFALFNEAIFKKSKLKEWLEWDDSDKEFKNTDNLKKLLGWYLGDEDDVERPRLSRINPDIRDIFSKLLLEENKLILDKFENGDISIEEARRKMDEKEYHQEAQKTRVDVDEKIKELESIKATLNTLPLPEIIKEEDKMESILKKLEEIENISKTQKEIINKMRQQKEE